MVLLALLVFLVATVGSVAYAARSAWRLWRTFKGTSGRLGDALGRVSAAGAATEQHAVGLSANSERLAAATERLQQGLAAFAAIRQATSEPRTLLGSIRGAVPRK
jgi:hypothetical protein